MARRVKKTDTREVDHWVSTDDGRHLPIDKDGNIIFSSSKKSTSKSDSKYKKNLNGTYQRQEMRDGTLVQATVIPGRDKGKDFYTIRTGIGDDFKSSDERYSTLSSAKKAADEMLKGRLNSKDGKIIDTSKKSEGDKKEDRIEASSFNKLANSLKEKGLFIAENQRTDPIPRDGSIYPIYNEKDKKYYEGTYNVKGKTHSMTISKKEYSSKTPTRNWDFSSMSDAKLKKLDNDAWQYGLSKKQLQSLRWELENRGYTWENTQWKKKNKSSGDVWSFGGHPG